MQHVSTETLVRRAIRCQICPHCHRRPKGSENLGPRVARLCEPNCPIFRYLPKLEEIAARHANEPGAYEAAIRDLVCQTCTLSPTAGDYCVEGMTRNCPLATYVKQAVELIEGLLAIR